ncbi:MAG: hypothetical protein KAS48_07715 [Gammaproteobacteria bacterium]|nr:hypothetical protein [Gammaproteobacteria bacterium]
MNGICGIIVGKKKNVDCAQHFSKMLSMLTANYGHKSDFTSISKQIYIGAVSDPSGDNRFGLVSDANESIFCAVHGNCYLDEEIRSSVSEKYGITGVVGIDNIPYAYLMLGENLPMHLTGDFNIVIADMRTRAVMVFNSRFGMLPLYYSSYGDVLVFCTSLRALTRSEQLPLHLNKTTLVESAIFNYPISDNSFIENVNTLPSGSLLSVGDGVLKLKRYWDVKDLFCGVKYSRDESIDLIDDALRRIIHKYISGRRNFGLSLTGGWDGRLILSYLKDVPKDRFFLYSFGGLGSADTEIPKNICADLGYEYKPFILDENYLKTEFCKYADETILRSYGMRSYLRAHYLYSMAMIQDKTDLVLSGNCGSNLLKNVNSTGSVVSNSLYQVFNSGFSKDVIGGIFDSFQGSDFMRLDDNDKERFVDTISNLKPDSGLTLNQQFYEFLLSIIERKYFGAEIASYPGGLTNQSPFIDYEFVSTIAQTPYFGAHYEFFGRKISDRWTLAKLYAALIKKNHPRLADYETDRGFSLAELASWTYLPKIVYKRFFTKGSRHGRDNFNTNSTDGLFYSMMKKNGNEDDIYNINALWNTVNNNEHVVDREKLANCMSLLYWKTSCLH